MNNNKKTWYENYQQMIEGMEKELIDYINSIEDQVRRGIISVDKIIEWGQRTKEMKDEIQFHKELYEKFKNRTQ
jgi:phosphoheptose isomerase